LPTPRHTLLLLASATLLGCQEDPSFRLRWAIDPSLAQHQPLKPQLASPADCSSVGVMDVEIITRDPFGIVVDRRKRPCFARAFGDPEATVGGPELPPGPYAVEVRGVRRDGVGWVEPLSPLDELELEADRGCVPELDVPSGEQQPSCRLDSLVCDCAFVEVADGRSVRLDDFVLDAPPQCDDGVDNDLDGLVDAFDPACRLGRSRGELYAKEDTVVVPNAQILVRPSLLHDNPVVTCSGLGISRFVVTLDEGSTLAEPICADVLRQVFQASAMVEPGASYVLQVVAVDFSRQPLTATKELRIDVPPGGGGRFTIDVDFGPEDFLAPIVASSRILPRFSPFEGAGYVRQCSPAPNVDAGGLLELTEVRMRLLGARGQPLSPAAKLSDEVTPLDGETDLACSSTFQTEPLLWGEHLVELEALSPEGEVCFSNVGDPQLAAPGETALVVPRVFPLPDSCRDCTVDSDCRNPGVCDEGVCKATCLTDMDCPTGLRCTQSGLCLA
jgi:hypothetical protein